MDQNDFIKGAVIGGLLGGVAALLLAPKCGKDLRNDIIDGYDTVNKTSSDIIESVKDRGHRILNTIHGVEEEPSHGSMVSGAAIGSVIGIVAALLLAPQAGSRLREQLGERYGDIQDKAKKTLKDFDKTRHNLEDKIESKFDDWKEIFTTVVDRVSAVKNGKKSNHNDLLDLASLGLRLYDQFQKRR